MKRLVVLAALLTGMGAACAEGYVGGAFGPTRGDIDCSMFTQCDKTDTGWKLYAGTQVDDIWAVEAAYLKFGKAQVATASASADFDAHAVSVSGVGRYAMTPSLMAKGRLGVAYVQTRSSLGGAEGRAQLIGGLGVAYAVSPRMSLTLDADFTSAKMDGESAVVRLLSAGMLYAY